MAYTQADYDSLNAAVIALAAGTKVVRVAAMGKTTEWAQGDLSAARELLAEMKAELFSAAGSPGFFLTSTSKGL